LPTSAVSFGYAGEDLDVGKNLADNGVTLPGPAARRAGKKVELSFTFSWAAMDGKQPAGKKVEQKMAIEKKEPAGKKVEEKNELTFTTSRGVIGKNRQVTEKMKEKRRLEEQLEEDRFLRFVEMHLGGSRTRAEVLDAGNPGAGADRHNFMEPCSEAVRADAERFLNATSAYGGGHGSSGSGCGSYEVVAVFRNENHTLRYRYDVAKARLGGPGARIRKETVTSSNLLSAMPALTSVRAGIAERRLLLCQLSLKC